MPVRRLNHAVLFVRDVERSVSFYREVLGFAPIDGMDGLRGAAFLRAPASTNDHDLGLFEIGAQAGPSGAGQSTVGLYHLAWEVETLADLVEVSQRLQERNALVGLLRRFADLDFIPIHFDFVDAQGTPLFSVERKMSFGDRYRVTVQDQRVDFRVAAAVAVALDALMSR